MLAASLFNFLYSLVQCALLGNRGGKLIPPLGNNRRQLLGVKPPLRHIAQVLFGVIVHRQLGAVRLIIIVSGTKRLVRLFQNDTISYTILQKKGCAL